MRLVQQCLIAVVFDEYCLCRPWIITADLKMLDWSALFYFCTLLAVFAPWLQAICSQHDVHLVIFRAQWYRWPFFQECGKACWSFWHTE